MTPPIQLYRVSVKALIRDDQDRLLLVKEGGSHWELPGGGLDHHETIEEALRRELREETTLDLISFDPRPAFIWTYHSHYYDCEVLCLCYETTVSGEAKTTDHTQAVQYVDPTTLTMDDMERFTEGMFEDFANYQAILKP
ncbi:MAG TPA: NUDIX hydrolase [Candidatus Saccharimonadia bacterium]|jgi:ADP-ribose pyrophosphatase YjhB (NUDIX family)|nr:NUDIX hydrolase [Candidatus Saccharimonadia bacterium]